MQDTGASSKPAVAAEDLTLNDWMAQIREKKLRKIVPNGHKQAGVSISSGQGDGNEPTLLNEIQRMRRGLRSVSAVTRPTSGTASSKSSSSASTTTFIPPKLRSVSSPTRAAAALSQPASESATRKEEKAPESSTASLATGLSQNAPIASEDGDKALPIDQAVLEADDDDEFPLDIEDAAVKDTSAEVDAPPVTPSAGVFDATDKPIELTLPGAKKVPINDDDFPLDAETDATENIPDNHEQPPFTPSAGVFDLSDTPVELTLPKAKHAKKSTDFPLDAENTAKAPQANSDDMETIVAPSAGISSAAKPIKLAPPPKGKSQAASKLQDATGEDVPLSAAAKQDQLLTTEASKGKTKQDTSRTGQQDGADKAEGNETIQAKMSSKQRMELSRTLAKILRHSAAGESLAVRPDGYISIPALLSRPKLKKLKATLEKIQEVVALDNKSRYALQDFDGVLHIRANQGHSIKVDDLELSRIEDASSLPVILHGTNEAALQLIKQFGGLSKMQRNHIHLATGKYGEEGVISGVRKDCTVFIHIDLAKAMADGIVFYKSANGVILTEGADGVLPEKYFTKIEQPTSSAPPEQNPAISSKKDF